MNTLLTICVCFLALMNFNDARSTRQQIRNALGMSPLFSHQRGHFEPQNVIVEVDAKHVPETEPLKKAPQNVHVKRNKHNSPAKAESIVKTGNMVNKPIAAGRPMVSRKPLGRKISSKGPSPLKKIAFNDRMANTMNKAPRRSNRKLRKVQKKNKCPFNIPSFILPDMDVTQVDFEQHYLIPALRAHFFQPGAACRNRALTIYIDWLLHLRQKLFNI